MLSLARRICHLTSHQVTWGHIQVTSHDVSVFERGIPYLILTPVELALSRRT